MALCGSAESRALSKPRSFHQRTSDPGHEWVTERANGRLRYASPTPTGLHVSDYFSPAEKSSDFQSDPMSTSVPCAERSQSQLLKRGAAHQPERLRHSS